MVQSMVNHRKENHHAQEQFKVFQKILREHCEGINLKEDNTLEIFDSNSDLIAEIDYFNKKVLCQDNTIQSHLLELLQIHHHSCVPLDSS